MHVDENNMKMTPSKKQVYKAHVVHNSTRVIFVPLEENDPRWKKYRNENHESWKSGHFAETLERFASITSKNKALIAVSSSAIILFGTLVIFSILTSPALAWVG